MMILPVVSLPITALAMSPNNVLPTALGLVLALTPSPSTTSTSTMTQPIQPLEPQITTIQTQTQIHAPSNVPVLEVLKVYGKLAGPDCYGKKAPPGSSCQIRLRDLEQTFLSPVDAIEGSPTGKRTILSREEFSSRLEPMEFQWPLKPYGINEQTLTKTAVMNKGAETRVFMDELESRSLYDPRNPAGPLPTSLRPAMNQKLQREGILDGRAIDMAYEALFGSDNGKEGGLLSGEADTEFLDYYDFLKRIGPNSISWPK